jgi:hypothetical protein
MRDIVSLISPAATFAPAVVTATANGATVDLRGFDAAAVIVESGAIVGAGNVTVKLQDSADGSAWVDVAAAGLQGVLPAALAAATVFDVGYVVGVNRYLRAVATLNSGTSVALSVVVVRGQPHIGPAA